MKVKVLFVIVSCMSMAMSAQMANNAFNLNNDYGDLRMRRYVSGDLTWKRALVSGTTQLSINHGGDYPDGVRIQGTKLVIDNKLGVGTTDPVSLFEARTPSTNNRIWLNYNDTPSISFVPNNGNSIFHIAHHLDNRLTFSHGSNVDAGNLLTIMNNGNIGIGTLYPDAKLAVNGNIHTKEVKVDLVGWSDFVFEDTYSLPTLEEVEQHIKEKGHLKDIPSAKDVEENGIYLGEMDAKLLQKIEELTLYAIEQEKKLKEQENINQKLDTKNQELEARLIKLEQMMDVR